MTFTNLRDSHSLSLVGLCGRQVTGKTLEDPPACVGIVSKQMCYVHDASPFGYCDVVALLKLAVAHSFTAIDLIESRWHIREVGCQKRGTPQLSYTRALHWVAPELTPTPPLRKYIRRERSSVGNATADCRFETDLYIHHASAPLVQEPSPQESGAVAHG